MVCDWDCKYFIYGVKREEADKNKENNSEYFKRGISSVLYV